MQANAHNSLIKRNNISTWTQFLPNYVRKTINLHKSPRFDRSFYARNSISFDEESRLCPLGQNKH